MIDIEIDKKELHRAYRNFNTLTSSRAMGRVMNNARAAGARVIASKIRKGTAGAYNKKTGRLKKAIKAEKKRPRWKGYWEVRADTRYAYNVEYGQADGSAEPHPYFLGAAIAAGPEAFIKSGNAFMRSVERELKKGY